MASDRWFTQDPQDVFAALLDLLPKRPAWMADALCSEYPRSTFFPTNLRDSRLAKSICARCSVQDDCRAYALSVPQLHGVWGGTDERQRRQLRAAAAAEAQAESLTPTG